MDDHPLRSFFPHYHRFIEMCNIACAMIFLLAGSDKLAAPACAIWCTMIGSCTGHAIWAGVYKGGHALASFSCARNASFFSAVSIFSHMTCKNCKLSHAIIVAMLNLGWALSQVPCQTCLCSPWTLLAGKSYTWACVHRGQLQSPTRKQGCSSGKPLVFQETPQLNLAKGLRVCPLYCVI